MTSVLAIFLLIAAFICFFFAALGVPTRRFNLIALGLALWVATLLLGHVSIS